MSFLEAFNSIFEKGGPVLVLIFIQFVLMWYFASQKYLYFKSKFSGEFEDFQSKLESLNAKTSFLMEAKIDKEVSILKTKINKNFSVIKVLVMICPLLGLLGTVTGMVSVFDVLAVAGSGNARAMASGISQATIPTMAGMVGALAGLFITKFLKDNAQKANAQVTDFLTQLKLKKALIQAPKEGQ